MSSDIPTFQARHLDKVTNVFVISENQNERINYMNTMIRLLNNQHVFDKMIIFGQSKERFACPCTDINIRSTTFLMNYGTLVAETQQNKPSSNKTNGKKILYVFDNPGEAVYKNTFFKYLIMNGRHFNCFVVIGAYMSHIIPPSIRSNVDLCIVAHQLMEHSEMERLRRHYFDSIEKQVDFDNLYQRILKNKMALVLKNTYCLEDDQHIFKLHKM